VLLAARCSLLLLALRCRSFSIVALRVRTVVRVHNLPFTHQRLFDAAFTFNMARFVAEMANDSFTVVAVWLLGLGRRSRMPYLSFLVYGRGLPQCRLVRICQMRYLHGNTAGLAHRLRCM
jgi:hypothetical protein